MNIKTFSRPKNITLVGNPETLEESEEQLRDDPMNCPQENINLPDLVFTLRHNPRQYLRPCVRYENGKLQVISNKTFYQAAKQAGLTKISFDLLTQGLPALEELMQKFSLESSPFPIQREFMERFLFFRIQPRIFQYESDLVIPNPENFSEEFQRNNCLAYKIMIEPKKTGEIDHELVATLVNQNSYLRSINGITSRDWNLGKYIR